MGPRLDVAVVEPDASKRASLLDALPTHGISARAYGSARSALEALETSGPPRIVLFELDVPGESSFRAIRAMRARSPDIVVIAHTRQDSDDWIFGGLVAGCVGYVLKDDALLTPADAIEVAARGGAPMSDSVSRRVVTRLHAPLDDTPALSARERSVLAALADGASYEEAGTRLGISLSTVRTHIQRAYAKLGVSTKSEATMRAVRLGLLA